MKIDTISQKLVAILVTVSCFSTLAQPPTGGPGGGSSSDEVLEAIEVRAYEPTEIPDRITLTINGDPSIQMAVNWRTNDQVIVSTATAEITLASGSSDLADDENIIRTISSSELATDDYTSMHHAVAFEGLLPGTKYVYRVGNNVLNADNEQATIWSEWAQFSTAKSGTSKQVTPFSFIYFGDAQNGLKSHWARVIREAYSDMPDAKFMLHAGDLINEYSGSDQEWGEWFYGGGWLNSRMPQVATPGNHEYTRGDSSLTAWWRPHFSFPENGPDDTSLGLSETAYYFDYQGVRFISIDSQAMSSSSAENIATAQAEWLIEVLSDNPNTWTVVYHHHPVWPAGNGRSAHPWLESLYKEIYEDYGVDLVLQGHDHTYARGDNLNTGLSYYNSDNGPIYVVSVAGSKMYDSDAEWADVTGQDTQLYQLIDINNKRIRYQALRADGEPYDEFVIKKSWKRHYAGKFKSINDYIKKHEDAHKHGHTHH